MLIFYMTGKYTHTVMSRAKEAPSKKRQLYSLVDLYFERNIQPHKHACATLTGDVSTHYTSITCGVKFSYTCININETSEQKTVNLTPEHTKLIPSGTI